MRFSGSPKFAYQGSHILLGCNDPNSISLGHDRQCANLQHHTSRIHGKFFKPSFILNRSVTNVRQNLVTTANVGFWEVCNTQTLANGMANVAEVSNLLIDLCSLFCPGFAAGCFSLSLSNFQRSSACYGTKLPGFSSDPGKNVRPSLLTNRTGTMDYPNLTQKSFMEWYATLWAPQETFLGQIWVSHNDFPVC